MEFENYEAFVIWLERRARAERTLVALRAALRVWPLVGRLSADERLELSRSDRILASCRSLISAQASIYRYDAGTDRALRQCAAKASAPNEIHWATQLLDPMHDGHTQFASADELVILAAYSCAVVAIETDSPEPYASYCVARAAEAADTGADWVLRATYYDCFADAPHRNPLWYTAPGTTRPLLLSKYQSQTVPVSTIDPAFDFWSRWYVAVELGKPLDCDLLYRIATEIPDEIWTGEDAPHRVAKEIARIEAEWEVERTLREIRAEAVQVQNRLGVGGNNPPEEIEVDPDVLRPVTVVWAALDDIENELKAEAPDKARVEAALFAVRSGLSAIVRWTGRKLDLLLDTTIKWGVPAAGGSAGGYFALNPHKLEALIKAVENWLPYLH